MTDRTTKVNLVANVAGYVAGMELAAQKTRALGTASERLAAQRAGFDAVGRSMVAVGAIAAVAVGLAIKSFAEFDAKMSQVQSLSHATADDMNLLSDAALHMGQSLGLSANEVADAEIELVKAGIAVSDILGGALRGSLVLAAAGQIDVAKATEIATIAMTQFGLKGADIPHVADLLAAGADKALGGVADLGEALKSGGLVAAQFGVSLDETAGVLAAFANAGLIGEVAGTDLRQMLLKLAAPAADAQKVMDELGISIYDQSGKFVGLANLSGQLHDKLVDQTEATRNADLATIFGARAIAGANVLYKEGAEGISKWTDEVNDSGFAAKQAAGKMDNLKGDVTKLEAAFTTGLIETGSNANEVLRGIVQGVTGLVAALAGAPTPVLIVGLALTALVAVIGLVGGGALLAVPRIAAFKVGLTELGITAGGAARGLGLVGGAVAIAGAILAFFAAKQAEATANTQEFRDSLDQTTGALTSYSLELVRKKLAESGAFDAAKRAGVSQKELTDAIIQGGNALKEVQDKIGALNTQVSAFQPTGKGLETVGTAAHDASVQIGEMSGELAGGRDALYQEGAAAKESGEQNLSAADAYKQAADTAATLESNLSTLIDTINKANGVGQDAVSTNAAYQKAITDAAQAVTDFTGANGVSAANLDENTVAGSANADMLASVAKKSQDAAKAQYDLDHNVVAFKGSLDAGRQALYDQAFALTGSADAAQAFTDKVYAIPSEKEFTLIANTATAQEQVNQFIRTNDGRTISVNVGYRPTSGAPNAFNEAGGFYSRGVKAFESGGFPSGIYAGRQGGIHKFAEETLPWEAYISPKPGARAQNINIWEETGRRLGVSAGSAGGSFGGASSGAVTALVDPSFVKAVRQLAEAHRATLDEVGLAQTSQSGSARLQSLGAN